MSIWEDMPSPRATLAEILVSRTVGITHIRLVGEILVADAMLNSWLADQGKKSMTPDEWVEWAEVFTDYEDRYKTAWNDLVQANPTDVEQFSERLKRLEETLSDTAEVLRTQLSRLREKHR